MSNKWGRGLSIPKLALVEGVCDARICSAHQQRLKTRNTVPMAPVSRWAGAHARHVYHRFALKHGLVLRLAADVVVGMDRDQHGGTANEDGVADDASFAAAVPRASVAPAERAQRATEYKGEATLPPPLSPPPTLRSSEESTMGVANAGAQNQHRRLVPRQLARGGAEPARQLAVGGVEPSSKPRFRRREGAKECMGGCKRKEGLLYSFGEVVQGGTVPTRSCCKACWIFVRRCLGFGPQPHRRCVDGPCPEHLQRLKQFKLPPGVVFRGVDPALLELVSERHAQAQEEPRSATPASAVALTLVRPNVESRRVSVPAVAHAAVQRLEARSRGGELRHQSPSPVPALGVAPPRRFGSSARSSDHDDVSRAASPFATTTAAVQHSTQAWSTAGGPGFQVQGSAAPRPTTPSVSADAAIAEAASSMLSLLGGHTSRDTPSPALVDPIVPGSNPSTRAPPVAPTTAPSTPAAASSFDARPATPAGHLQELDSTRHGVIPLQLQQQLDAEYQRCRTFAIEDVARTQALLAHLQQFASDGRRRCPGCHKQRANDRFGLYYGAKQPVCKRTSCVCVGVRGCVCVCVCVCVMGGGGGGGHLNVRKPVLSLCPFRLLTTCGVLHGSQSAHATCCGGNKINLHLTRRWTEQLTIVLNVCLRL